MKRRVLVVDDMEINRDILTDILEDRYEVLTAENGKTALRILDENKDRIAIMLLDLTMPEMNGFDVLDRMKESGLIRRLPVIIITGDESPESEKRCFDFGVTDFIRKPFNEALVKLRVGNTIDLYEYKNGLEDKVLQQNDTLNRQFITLKKQAQQLAESNSKIIDILATVVESRNLESGEHIQRVKIYTKILATQLMHDYPEYGLTQHKVDVMVPASALHDVGKIAIPDKILLKPGKLDKDEFEVMKSHTTRGCVIIDNIKGVWDEEYAKMSYEICRHHHERYDGKGYPDGLTGDDIPVAAQVVSIADVYDALVSVRVYKGAFAKEDAYNMIVGGECGTFSPKLLECFRKTRSEFEAVTEKKNA